MSINLTDPPITPDYSSAAHPWFEQAYADLKRLAHSRLRQQGRAVDLDTTALVHESFMRLADAGQLPVSDRPAFFGYVARVMRNIVVDHVRQQHAVKRGGDQVWVTLNTGVEGEVLDDDRLLRVDSALSALERLEPALFQLAQMRYFAGLSVKEIAELRSTSIRTIEREWQKARAFLKQLMAED